MADILAHPAGATRHDIGTSRLEWWLPVLNAALKEDGQEPCCTTTAAGYFHDGWSANDAAMKIAHIRVRFPDYATEAREQALSAAAKIEAEQRWGTA